MSILLEINQAHLFLYGQLELYKHKFAETDNNTYLKMMHEFNHAKNILRMMEETCSRLNRENRELQKENSNLKKLLE